MKRAATVLVLTMMAPAGVAHAQQQGPLHHDLTVRLDPAAHVIGVVDRLDPAGAVVPDVDGAYRFVLHAGLVPRVETPGWDLRATAGPVTAAFFGINATSETVAEDVPLEGWLLIPSGGAKGPVTLRYGGVLHHPLATQGEEYQRSFSETPGIIGEEGVFLAGTSFWVPTFGDGLLTFELRVDGLARPWSAISQGRRLVREAPGGGQTITWTCPHPSEEIYLVGGPWHEYTAEAGEIEVLALLREDDPALAQRYLQATGRYLRMYGALLPPFPYASFALVENFWETGYGMPGFTLLGPRVIRFPWILTSSYPHELLHNWWGNSVYVDFDQGNWCEGITAYMADHMLAEQRGEAQTYRRATLKKFTDFVHGGEDMPLTAFRSRHSAASEAVGYGKSLMLFHMVRRAVGDEAFGAALSAFYERHRFTRASWSDLADAFSEVTGGEWGPFFTTWTTRTGAPLVEIVSARVGSCDDCAQPWKLEVELRQAQDGEPFPISLPIAVTLADGGEPLWAEVGSCGRLGRTCRAVIPCPSRPMRLDVDPAFDVMRRLDPLEVPPALSTLFGADDPLYVLPFEADAQEIEAWRSLAGDWQRPEGARVVLDSEIEDLPPGNVWVLGWRNRYAAEVATRVGDQGVELGPDRLALPGRQVEIGSHSVVLTARGEHDPADAIGWVAADLTAAIPGLARKLPHYTRYSFLAFEGEAPDNVAKGLWRPLSSPLVRNLGDGEMADLHLPAREPLTPLPPLFDSETLGQSVAALAAAEMEGRGLGSEGLERATAWVEQRLGEAGLEPAGEDGFRSSWTWRGGQPEREMVLTNLLARLRGTDPALADEPVLVMAHLDHLGRGWPEAHAEARGEIHPGADDNASGVAVLLELARVMASQPRRPRPILFAVTTGEEVGLLGARRLVGGMAPDGRPSACVNLDTVGRLAEGKLYVLNADSAREWRFIFMGVGHTTGAPVSIVREPLDSSDQVACLEHGIPAVQLFTGPNQDYHRPSDTVDKIDDAGMATVAEAALETVGYLAERTEPMTVTIASDSASSGAAPPEGRGERRASLGTMPDFGFPGPGVKVKEVAEGSAAEAAGIRAGDVITALGGAEVGGLRDLSSALKAHAPGDKVEVRLERDGESLLVDATLGAR